MLQFETCEMEAVKLNKFPGLPLQKIDEVAILEQLRCLDPDTSAILKWNSSFTHQNHICISFELLDQDLRDYVESRGKGLLIPEIKTIIWQVATALQHLSTFRIVHADIRPEKIVLVDWRQQPLRVHLIDFGLAFQVGDHPFLSSSRLQSSRSAAGCPPPH